jgi:hypothetical protein
MSMTEVVTENGVAAARPAMLDVKYPSKVPPLAAMLKKIHSEYKKSPYQLAADVLGRFLSKNSMLADEYMTLRLFDDAHMSAAEKDAFVGVFMRRKIAGAINTSRHWDAVTSNKLVTEMVLGGFGFPVVETRALFHPTRRLPAILSLASSEALAAYLRTAEHYPMFGKPTDASLSLGTAGLVSYEGETDTIQFLNGKTAPVDDFVAEVVENYTKGYLLQECLDSHPLVRDVAGPAISCVRFYTLVVDGKPEVFRAAWKLPAGTAMADNFWRGNLLASLDYKTGRVGRVIKGSGLGQQILDRHPDTGRPFADFGVPDWAATKEMVLQAAAALSSVGLIGWDVAITSRGGVVVETNNCPDFMLAQLAEGRGVLDETLKGILAEQRAKAKKARQAKRAARFSFSLAGWRSSLGTVTDIGAKID